MRAVILVGGEGTRLRPLTLTTPKQMLPIAGRPMIERVVSHVASHGVDEAILSLGYRPDVFMDAYPDGTCAGVKLVYAVESEPLDTAGAIRFAATEAGVDDTFIVLNGDVLTELDVTALVRFHREHGAEATIALTPVEDPSRFGVVPTDEHGRVEAFIEKPPRGEAPTNLINAGTYVLEPSVLDRIPAGRRVSIERETFPLIVADLRMYAMASSASWIDAGTPEAYISANLAYAHDGGDGADVGKGAKVVDSVIGGSVVVGEGTVVDGSVILEGAVLEEGSTIRRSIVGAGAVVGAGSTLSDLTVVGHNEVVPAGSVLSGARVPETA